MLLVSYVDVCLCVCVCVYVCVCVGVCMYICASLLLCILGAICPEGHYCELGSSAPAPCMNGTYMNYTGAGECIICPEGYYCVNRDRADICSQGFFCPVGTGADLMTCPAGTFGATEGLSDQSQCTDCTG